MLKSIARARAKRSGGSGAMKNCRRLERMKNTMATVPSTEKDTNGSKMMLNHL